jgi:hypothetical protein
VPPARERRDFPELNQATPAPRVAGFTDGLDSVVLQGRALEAFAFVGDLKSLTNPVFSPKTGHIARVFESGPYSLILCTRKPAATLCRDWMPLEVPPGLRQGFCRMRASTDRGP